MVARSRLDDRNEKVKNTREEQKAHNGTYRKQMPECQAKRREVNGSNPAVDDLSAIFLQTRLQRLDTLVQHVCIG